MDEAAYACAAGFSGRYCVTVSVSGIRFVAPIHIGEMVEVHAPGVGALLNRIAAQQLANLRVLQHDAVEVLDRLLIGRGRLLRKVEG